MIQLLFNKKLIAGSGVILLIVIVGIVALFVLNKPQYPFENVLITTGGSLRITGFDGFIIPVADEDKGKEYNLPVTTKLALKDGWLKASSCIPGEGVYFTKGEEKSIILIFDLSDNLIGIYQHTLHEMPEPWIKTVGPLKTDGSTIVEDEHYGAYIFLINPARSCDANNDYESTLVSDTTLPSYLIPYNSVVAVSEGWTDPFFCSPGRGKYYQKDGFNHVLMYDANGNVIGIYQHTLHEMPSPWFKTKELIGGGSIPIIDFEHYGFFIYFEDPMNACQSSSSKSVGTGGTHYAGPKAERSEYGPTPTPTVILTVIETINKLSEDMASDSRTFTLINAVDQTNIVGKIDASRISAFISSLTNIQEGTSKWINNISHRGLSADGDDTGLKSILENVESDGLKVNLWVDTDNKINLIEITGTITQNGKEFSILHISSE